MKSLQSWPNMKESRRHINKCIEGHQELRAKFKGIFLKRSLRQECILLGEAKSKESSIERERSCSFNFVSRKGSAILPGN